MNFGGGGAQMILDTLEWEFIELKKYSLMLSGNLSWI